eukprot:GHVN01020679.1.p1 GENE.GHVN01020679.1~~GHVN01020679.1.p1  ORF type:complete len:869 (-),score=190.05 GHVN01020679.1:1081-3687(-)
MCFSNRYGRGERKNSDSIDIIATLEDRLDKRDSDLREVVSELKKYQRDADRKERLLMGLRTFIEKTSSPRTSESMMAKFAQSEELIEASLIGDGESEGETGYEGGIGEGDGKIEENPESASKRARVAHYIGNLIAGCEQPPWQVLVSEVRMLKAHLSQLTGDYERCLMRLEDVRETSQVWDDANLVCEVAELHHGSELEARCNELNSFIDKIQRELNDSHQLNNALQSQYDELSVSQRTILNELESVKAEKLAIAKRLPPSLNSEGSEVGSGRVDGAGEIMKTMEEQLSEMSRMIELKEESLSAMAASAAARLSQVNGLLIEAQYDVKCLIPQVALTFGGLGFSRRLMNCYGIEAVSMGTDIGAGSGTGGWTDEVEALKMLSEVGKVESEMSKVGKVLDEVRKDGRFGDEDKVIEVERRGGVVLASSFMKVTDSTKRRIAEVLRIVLGVRDRGEAIDVPHTQGVQTQSLPLTEAQGVQTGPPETNEVTTQSGQSHSASLPDDQSHAGFHNHVETQTETIEICFSGYGMVAAEPVRPTKTMSEIGLMCSILPAEVTAHSCTQTDTVREVSVIERGSSRGFGRYECLTPCTPKKRGARPLGITGLAPIEVVPSGGASSRGGDDVTSPISHTPSTTFTSSRMPFSDRDKARRSDFLGGGQSLFAYDQSPNSARSFHAPESLDGALVSETRAPYLVMWEPLVDSDDDLPEWNNFSESTSSIFKPVHSTLTSLDTTQTSRESGHVEVHSLSHMSTPRDRIYRDGGGHRRDPPDASRHSSCVAWNVASYDHYKKSPHVMAKRPLDVDEGGEDMSNTNEAGIGKSLMSGGMSGALTYRGGTRKMVSPTRLGSLTARGEPETHRQASRLYLSQTLQ